MIDFMKVYRVFFPALCAILMFSCAGASSYKKSPLISDLRQYTVYSGERQPADIRSAREIPFTVTYFTAPDDLALDYGGTTEAPVDAGLYYVRVDFPETQKRAAAPGVIVEYLIDRAPVNIIADEVQYARYDGNPKRVQAETDAPVSLSFSYFPSRDALRTAAVLETSSVQRSVILKSLTRVERAPREPGTYYAAVYFQGDNNYKPVEKEIEFHISAAK